MASAMELYKKHKAEKQAFVDYAVRGQRSLQIAKILGFPLETCRELYKQIMEEASEWAALLPYQNNYICEVAYDHAILMMITGTWKFEDWKKWIAEIVKSYRTVRSWLPDFNWEEIEEIPF